MKTVKILKSILFIYFSLGLLLYLFQRSILYQPTANLKHDFNTLEITTADNVIQALVTNKQAGEVILYFGGNAENVAYSAADYTHEFPNHSTYLLKYRGYSGAQGSASEANLFADALALFDHINQIPNTRITVIGRSLGSGIATFLASKRPVDKLVLITPFDSIRNVAQALIPIFPMDLLLKDPYDSQSRAVKISAPTLVVMAKYDEVIPYTHTKSLMQSIPKHQLNTTTIQAGHNDLDLMPEYFTSMKLFLNTAE